MSASQAPNPNPEERFTPIRGRFRRRDGQRHGFNRPCAALAWALAFFVGMQGVATAVLEWGQPKLRDPEFGYRLASLRRQLARQPGHPLVVMLGSSRVAEGIRPETLETCWSDPTRAPVVFNYGMVGSGPVMELLCLNRLLAAGIHPDWVLVEYWPPFWCEARENAEEKRIDVDRLTWHDVGLLRRYWSQPDQLVLHYGEARLVPAFSHRLCVMSQYAPSWVPWGSRQDGTWRALDSWGWLPNEHDHRLNAAEYQRGMDRLRDTFTPVLDYFHAGDVADRAIRELLETCRRERISVALIVLPEGSDFRRCYLARVRTEANRYVRNLSREYRLPLMDMRTWAADEAFSDGFHLTPEGAATFSRRFGRQALGSLLNAR